MYYLKRQAVAAGSPQMREGRGLQAGQGSEAMDEDGGDSAEVEISDTGSREVAQVTPLFV